jgi:hypothetical protein
MEEEIWKDVIGYEGLYQVSSLGRVKSLSRGKEKILKPEKRNEYYSVVLSKNSIKKHKTNHQLVAESFIDKDYRSKNLVVNHKNFNKLDNRLENLEVVSIRENSNRKHIKSSSKYTGVTKSKYKGWISTIVLNGKNMYLGSFDSEKEASEYYEAALLCINKGNFEDIVVKLRGKTKGVYKYGNRYISRITINGKLKYLGMFNTEEEACSIVEEYKKSNGIGI